MPSSSSRPSQERSWFGCRLSWDAAWLVRGAALPLLTVATMPVLLFQVTQPMNDVVVTAVWMAVLAASLAAEPRTVVAGWTLGLATLIRPNLAPASLVVAVWLMVVAGRGDAPMLRSARSAVRRRHAIAFGLAAFPSLIVLFALNTRLYGTSVSVRLRPCSGSVQCGQPVAQPPALRTGGVRNTARTAAAGNSRSAPAETRASNCLARPRHQRSDGGRVSAYARPYPSGGHEVPATRTGAAHGSCNRGPVNRFSALVRPPLVRVAIVMLTVTAIVWFGLATARTRQVFELQQLESRFRRAGEVVRDELPANAIVIAVWQSGAVRFHAGRMSLLWDSLDPLALESAVGWLSMRGFEPYLCSSAGRNHCFAIASCVPRRSVSWIGRRVLTLSARFASSNPPTARST